MKSKKRKRFVLLLVCLLLAISSCYVYYVYHKLSAETANRIRKGAIENIIASESPVYFDDEKTPIGVFFEKTHRNYIPFEEIPKIFVKAIVAAEDANFFSHHGFEPKSIIRALWANVTAGRVVQGGSTITQQTAKNIFKREMRSYKAKFKELVQAALLERKYTKEEILEMYVNQFFVTGYGKGLGIAAQYFFDKEVRNLNLVEAAFIAGSVKGPNLYNPFIKKNEAEREEARRLAKQRKDYVLTNMYRKDFITQEEYTEAKEREVPFKQGNITYQLNVILDYIREQLESNYFRKILQEQGVDNVATSGIRIYTSINREIQNAALRSLRTHLPLMDAQLGGCGPRKMDEIWLEMLAPGSKKDGSNLPFLARITQINPSSDKEPLLVAWDDGGGIIDVDGLRPLGEACLKSKGQRQTGFNKEEVSSFLKSLEVGDLVPVERMTVSEADGTAKLLLTRIPEIEGGLVVLHHGMIKAMAGGYFNHFFNRAVDAKRQIGSMFKPIVYTAALQLKWNSLDALQNFRDVFPFQGTFYLPRPDHPPQSPVVSIAWAGAKSENLATVWLLYHLTDHLNLSEFREIVDLVGLSRKKDESESQYIHRIRDQCGVVVDTAAIMDAAFEEAKKEIESDVIFGGYEDYEKIKRNLKRLHFRFEKGALNEEDPEERGIGRFSYERLQSLNRRMKEQAAKIRRIFEENARGAATSPPIESLSSTILSFYVDPESGERGDRLVYLEDRDLLSQIPLARLPLEWLNKRGGTLPLEKIWVDGLLPSGILDLLLEHTNRNFRKLVQMDRYGFELLSKIRDFRTLVHLYYVIHLSKQMGISTNLDPVLSFPLGSNAVSILETALAYQTMMNGKVYPVTEEADSTMMAPIITKIVDREGEILWEYKPEPRRVLSGGVCAGLSEILREVMETGTGSRAGGSVQAVFHEGGEKIGVPIPSFGKTGTANRFTNSSFAGFIPGTDEQTHQLDLMSGYVIAAYVGYDDNRPMKSDHVVIYGASGALPVWLDTANAVVNMDRYRENLQPADLAFGVWVNPALKRGAFVPVPVSPVSGLPVNRDMERNGPSFTRNLNVFSQADLDDSLRLKRQFEPTRGEGM